MKRYLIVKYKKNYFIYDTYDSFFENNNDIQIKVYKNKNVYRIYKYEVVDDYFCDIGAITHTEVEKWYSGILVFESDNLLETAMEYCRLEIIRFEMYDKAKKIH